MIMSPLPAFHRYLILPPLTSLVSLVLYTRSQLLTHIHHRLVSAYGGEQESLFWAWVAFLNIILFPFIYFPVNFIIFFLFMAD